MNTGLKRDLGLYAVFTFSIGAMIGSGIFVLPGLAAEITGPGLILAFFIAGLVVMPAALSKSEMATAMPHAGGTYLYIDRAMGPLLGTVAGIGVWFSLVFKSAFALAGLGGYLAFLANVDSKQVALGISLLLIVLNVAGAKLTGRAQMLLVTGVLAVLVVFVSAGSFEVDSANFEPFLTAGWGGLLTATAVIFVSYAGVTKIAGVAEEVKRPGRTIPLGILTSVGLMMILYPVIVLVIIGVTPLPVLAGSPAPMAEAAAQFMGSLGVDIIAVTAALALTSMANAGLLASSRYPLAMSRNALAPAALSRVGKRGTPIVAILATGATLLVLVAFVPILDIAKLASAFQLLVFALVNLALIAFRESNTPWYQPEFRSPAYPWVQLFGIFGALVLLTQMGLVPLLGALGIIVGGTGWYRVFGKSRAIRDSAMLDALRVRSTARLVALTENALNLGGKSRILIPVLKSTRTSRLSDLLRFAYHVSNPNGHVEVVEFESEADAARRSPGIAQGFEARTLELASRVGLFVEARVITTRDPSGALLDYVVDHGVDLVLSEFPRESRWTRRFINDMKDVRDHLDCDSIFLRNQTVGAIDTIAIVGSGGPYDVLKISLAARMAAAERCRLRFVHVIPEEARDAQAELVEGYHTRLEQLLNVETESVVRRGADLIATIEEAAGDADLVILGAASQRVRLFGDLADRIADSLDTPVMLVHATEHPRQTRLESLLERVIS